MSQKVLDGKFFKAIIISLVAILFSNVLLPTVNVFAVEEDDIYQKLDKIDQEEFDLVLNQITEYSEYDYETGKWVLSYEIVEKGLFTEEQYNRAEKSGEEWEKVEPLIRMRIFLEDKKLWNETIEADYKDEVNAEIDAAVKQADSVQKQKISEFIETTFEQPSFVQKEQIEKFREAGK